MNKKQHFTYLTSYTVIDEILGKVKMLKKVLLYLQVRSQAREKSNSLLRRL